MVKKRAGPFSPFSAPAFLALLLASWFLVGAGAAVVPVRMGKQVMRNFVSTAEGGVVRGKGFSGGGGGRRGGGFAGGGRRGGSGTGGSRGGGSDGRSSGGRSRVPYGGGVAVVGAHGGSHNGKHSGGSRGKDNCLVILAAATVLGLAFYLA